MFTGLGQLLQPDSRRESGRSSTDNTDVIVQRLGIFCAGAETPKRGKQAADWRRLRLRQQCPAQRQCTKHGIYFLLVHLQRRSAREMIACVARIRAGAQLAGTEGLLIWSLGRENDGQVDVQMKLDSKMCRRDEARFFLVRS